MSSSVSSSLEHCCGILQVTKDMWHLFEQEFRSLWTAAAKQGKGGELAVDALFGPNAPAGTEALEVGKPELLHCLPAQWQFCRELCEGVAMTRQACW